jgi:hypothetical protein
MDSIKTFKAVWSARWEWWERLTLSGWDL